MLDKISIVSACLLVVLACRHLTADEGPVTYRTHIRKIFRDHCASCHNKNRARAGLDLSSYGGAIQGSSSGRVLIKGDPQDSVLYLSMAHLEQPFMPPGKEPLESEVLETVRIWIETGLPEQPGDVQPTSPKSSGPDESQTTKMDSSGSEPAAASLATNSTAAATPADQPTSVTGPALRVSPVFRGQRATPVTALAVSPSGRWAAVSGQLQVLVFDLVESQLVGVLPFPEGEPFTLRFSADNQRLLAGGGVHSESGRIVIWDLAKGQRLRELGEEYDVVMAADLSPDGKSALLGGPERIVKVIDVETGQTRATLTKHTDWILEASFSPEGLIFATADRAGNVYAWESHTAADLHTLRGHRGAVTGISWTSDGNHCITAGKDGTIRFWDMHTGAAVRNWTAHVDGVTSIALNSADRLISAGRDNTLKVWSLEGERLSDTTLSELPLHVQPVGVDDVVVATWSGQVTKWNPVTGELVPALTIPQELATSDLAAVDQEVISPVMPDLPAVADEITTLPTPAGSTVNSPESPAQVAEVAQAHFLRVTQILPEAVTELRSAEERVQRVAGKVSSLRETVQTLASAPTRLAESGEPQNQNDHSATAAYREQRLADLESLVESLAAAQRTTESLEVLIDVELDAASLTKVALEKARSALSSTRKSQQSDGPAILSDDRSAEVLEVQRELQQLEGDLAAAHNAWESAQARFEQVREEAKTAAEALATSASRLQARSGDMRSTTQGVKQLIDQLQAIRTQPIVESAASAAAAVDSQ